MENTVIDLILPCTGVCIALHIQCFLSVCEKISHTTQEGFFCQIPFMQLVFIVLIFIT